MTIKYEEIISTIDLDEIYHAVTKKSRLGAPKELNYAAMIISLAELRSEVPTDPKWGVKKSSEGKNVF